MILVTLGTQDKQFIRLVKELDRLVENKTIKEKVIVQLVTTKYQTKNFETFDLIQYDKLEKLTEEASLIITHGGVGSILTGLKKGKKVIAIPRLSAYKEHTNDHQIQIVDEFYNTGYILKCDNPSDLENVLKKVKDFKPNKYVSNTSKVVKMIDDFIESI